MIFKIYPCTTILTELRMRGGHKDPAEGIRQVLGKHAKILLKVAVKLEKGGGDKTDNRIVVLTRHRLYIMTNKVNH